MLWFHSKEKERRLEMLQAITPTSKTSLKRQCLYAAKGNLKEAKELYEFFVEDLKDLPDNDPVPKTWQENTSNTVNAIMGWLRENQSTLAQGYSFIQSIVANRGALPALTVAEETEEALSPINE